MTTSSEEAPAVRTLGVCISGALGAVGRCLVDALRDTPGFRLHSAVARREQGRDAGEAIGGAPLGVRLGDDLEAALDAGPDVLVDYTHPSTIRATIAAAFARGIPVVIGTTGLADADFEEIDAAARRSGVGAATGNFALTAALMQYLARIAARHIPQWEVIEYGRAEKPDVPSGTARELAEVLGTVRRPEPPAADGGLIGPPEARGALFGGARVHSLRLPGNGVAVEVHFGLPGERLVLRHDEQSDARIFVHGTLLAARRVTERPGLVRGLDSLLFPPVAPLS
jgi:4-hydroxy-tetrahydrodipicolinate reductase